MTRKKILFTLVLVLVLSLLASVAYANGLARVTGGGGVYTYFGGYGTFGLTAVEKPNGQADGELLGIIHGDGQLHLDIDCLNIEYLPGVGKFAWMSGWTKAGNTLPDAYYTLVVVDGGDGMPDYVAYAQPSTGPGSDPSQGQQDCYHRFADFYFEMLANGNITVSP